MYKNGADDCFVEKTPFLKVYGGEMMAGRNKEPIDLVIAKGKKHLTKDEIEKRKLQEIKVDLVNIQVPTYLSDMQKKEFEELASKLKHINIMTELDEDALARYILVKDECLKVDEMLTKELNKTKNINVYKIVTIQKVHDKLHKQVRALASDLGLSISSRMKLVAPEPPKEPKENKFSKFT